MNLLCNRIKVEGMRTGAAGVAELQVWRNLLNGEDLQPLSATFYRYLGAEMLINTEGRDSLHFSGRMKHVKPMKRYKTSYGVLYFANQ